MPLPTRILLAVSDVVRTKLPVRRWSPSRVIVFLFQRWKKTENGRRAIDKFKLKVPIFGPLFLKTALSRFSRTLAVLSKSGVPILQALTSSQRR